MINSIVSNKDVLEIEAGYPKTLDVKGCGCNEVRLYLTNTDFLVLNKMTKKELSSELTVFEKKMSDSDMEKVVFHLNNPGEIEKSHQENYADNSDVAELARLTLSHPDVVNSNCSEVEFRSICFDVGTEKGYSRSVISECIRSYK